MCPGKDQLSLQTWGVGSYMEMGAWAGMGVNTSFQCGSELWKMEGFFPLPTPWRHWVCWPCHLRHGSHGLCLKRSALRRRFGQD